MNTGMHLMQALCAAIRRKQVDWDRPLAEEEWKELFRLAQEQHVLPIVVESIYGSNAFQSQPDSWRQQVIQKSIRITMGQTVRTSAFLELFEKMEQAGLHPLVMKGLACRVLYPSPDSRPSSDEDLLVSPEEFSQAADFLKTQGFETTGLSGGTDCTWSCIKVPFLLSPVHWGSLTHSLPRRLMKPGA